MYLLTNLQNILFWELKTNNKNNTKNINSIYYSGSVGLIFKTKQKLEI